MNPLGRRVILGAGTLTLSALATPSPGSAATAARPKLQAPFTLGVASGDPEPDGVVLWTRLAPRPLAADGRGGMPDRHVLVEWELARDRRFTQGLRRGRLRAHPRFAHAVHVEVTGLAPAREYYYRFRAEGHVSRIGRTRTAPLYAASPAHLRVAVASCANYEHGYFTAYRRMAQESPDLIVHLGDYFYEHKHGQQILAIPNVRGVRGPETVTLADYRRRHAQYKTDLDLQAAHAAAPWSVVFDDHEVDSNWAGLNPSDLQPEFAARRAAAFRAYWENMPLRRTSLPRGPDMQIYRRMQWGDLATLHLMDTRQYRDDQECGPRSEPGCAAGLDPSRTMTGAAQEAWLLDGLGASIATWDLLGQQVFFAQRDLSDEPGLQANMDGWDGYAGARQRILDGFVEREVRNPVVLTGDVHIHHASELHLDFADPSTQPVGVELVTTSVTSGGNGAGVSPRLSDVRDRNPHIKFSNNRRGYVLADFGRDHLRADFKTLPYVDQPSAPVSTAVSFVVEAGNPGLQPG